MMTSINYVLPPELLAEVLYDVTATHGAIALPGVLLTCRLWYNLAIREPRLWTHISLDTILASRLHLLPPEAAKRFAQLCVERSGHLAMHMSIHFKVFSTTDEGDHIFSPRVFKAKIHAMMEIDQFSSRLQTLVVHREGKVAVSEWFISCSILRTWVFPLQQLELHNHPLLPARCWINHIPSLTTVTLIDPVWHIPSAREPLDCNTQVVQLSLQRTSTWSLGDLVCLKVYRALATLELFSNTSRRSRFAHIAMTRNNISVLLDAVETLSLTGDIPHQILAALIFPALVTIEIRNCGVHHSMRHLQNTTLHRNVKRIEVFMTGQDNDSWTHDLASVLKVTLKLQTFAVLPSMLPHIPHSLIPDGVDIVLR
jgi:hypothetical protein